MEADKQELERIAGEEKQVLHVKFKSAVEISEKVWPNLDPIVQLSSSSYFGAVIA